MCTAVTYQTKDFYFGRTLDYECSYGEEVTVTPRGYPWKFRHTEAPSSAYAMIGMAHVAEEYPLYYEAVNEKGLTMAGLNFVGNAAYAEPREDVACVSQFELIPWILCRCATLDEAREQLSHICVVGTPFNANFPAAQLHWIVADASGAITVESMADGLHMYENPVGVLTNNPPFATQMFLLNNYIGLSPRSPENRFSSDLPLQIYSRGMGGMGLPGDLSSASRFVRAAFVKMNALSDDSENGSVSQFFHILGAVDQPRGCCAVGDRYEITLYTCCCNASRGIYYYTTYDNHQITAVDMHREDLNSQRLIRYPVLTEETIFRQN